MTKEKRDFVKDLLLQNTQHIKSDEDFDQFQSRADWLWEGFDRRNKVATKSVTKVKLSDVDIKNMNGLVVRWNATAGVKKNRTKPVDVEKQLTYLANMEELNADLWGEINRKAGEYLAYMVETAQTQYVPGLQGWIKDRGYKIPIGEEREKVKVNNEAFEINQKLAHARKMVDLGQDGWQSTVDELTEKLRVNNTA